MESAVMLYMMQTKSTAVLSIYKCASGSIVKACFYMPNIPRTTADYSVRTVYPRRTKYRRATFQVHLVQSILVCGRERCPRAAWLLWSG